MKKLPNILTMSRIVLIFFFVALANINSESYNFVTIPKEFSYTCHVIAYIIGIIAGVTDFFDGFLARRYSCESDFGRLMDPLADKVFITATFVMFSTYKIIPGWIVIAVLAREFLVTGLRLLAAKEGIVISADKSGKIKTAFQMILLLVGGAGWIHFCSFNIFEPRVWMVWYLLLLTMTALTLYSGLAYFVRNFKLFKNKF